MRAWLIRFLGLYLFDLLVLVVLGWLVPNVQVGFAALWAAFILALVTMWVKPLVHAIVSKMASRPAGTRSKLAEKLVQYLIVFVVALVVWAIVVAFTGVAVQGWFWGWVIPPVALLIAWAIYDVTDDSIDRRMTSAFSRKQKPGASAS